MITTVYWTGLFISALTTTAKAEEFGIRVIVSIVTVAAVIELVTIAIALASCIYLGIKLKRAKEEVAERRGDQRPRYYSYMDGDDGDQTIRVVHNTLYQTLRRDQQNVIQAQEVDASHAEGGPAASPTHHQQITRTELEASEHSLLESNREETRCREKSESCDPSYETVIHSDIAAKPNGNNNSDILQGLDDNSVTMDSKITIF